MDSTLQQLVELSQTLGLPDNDFVLLGEGNTSTRTENDTFWVKASGRMLHNIPAEGFVQMQHAATVALLDATVNSDAELLTALRGVTLATSGGQTPSIEAMMHAYLLQLPEVYFVGHTHPAPLNAILCSINAEALVTSCYFPDQIVCCGRAPVFIPYTDPGLPLARIVREQVNAWMQQYGEVPRAILMQNHGIFALGSTAKQVLSCSQMWVKTARVILGAMVCGGTQPMSAAQVERIATRPDEKLRQRIISNQ